MTPYEHESDDRGLRVGSCQACTTRRAGAVLSRLIAFPVSVYRLVVSPWLAPRCRFIPTCSEYALQALRQHGSVKGSWLAVTRLLRCNPWGGSGLDEVPAVRCRCVRVHLPLASDSQRAESCGKSAAFRVFG